MKTIIKNGMVVSPAETYEADILIDGEQIRCIGRDLTDEEARVIDAAGKYVIPGAVDVHTHMDLQAGSSRAVDDFYDGTVAAACGGTTSIVTTWPSARRAAACTTSWPNTTAWRTAKR